MSTKRRLPPWLSGNVKRTRRSLTYGNNRFMLRRRKFNKASHRTYQNGGIITRSQPIARIRGSFMPTSLRTDFTVSATWPETTAGGFINYAWRANSIHDPDVTLGGNRCTGVSSMSYLYNRYKVLRATMYLTMINNDTDDPLFVAIVPQRDTGAIGIANKEAIPGLPGAVTAIVCNQTGYGEARCTLHVATLCNQPKMLDEGYAAALNANPAQLVYFMTYFWNESGNALNATVTCRIVFDTILTDFNNDAQGIA